MTKSILITGSSSGIGYAAAHALRVRGWRVFASVRRDADKQRLEDEGLESLILDCQNADSIESGLAHVLSATDGTLGAVFNNAGYGLPGAVEDLPVNGLREIFETNVFGVHDLTRRIIPIMRAQGHGRIVQHSSGFWPSRDEVARRLQCVQTCAGRFDRHHAAGDEGHRYPRLDPEHRAGHVEIPGKLDPTF